uniref:NADPH--hemoprotein reductase n=1 Tax=Arcella intermedia TaxID=1963864 RepID=A0A6B2KZL3_9EUKA
MYWYFRPGNNFKEVDDLVVPMPKPLSTLPNQKAKSNKIKGDGIPLKILFYSQTGTAEDFSNRLGEELASFGFAPEVFDVENYNMEDLENDTLVIFITSTYGEGDPPDNAQEFHRWLMNPEREQTSFSHLRFSVFGLGNKTYDHFNKMGKEVDARLEALGGKRLFRLGLGDDDVNIEKDFLSWKKDFGIQICQEFKLDAPGSGPVAPVARRQRMVTHEPGAAELKGLDVHTSPRWRVSDEKPKGVPDIKNPYMAQIVVTRQLHSPSSDRSCMHVELSTHDDILAYHPGDHLGIFPENDLTMVHKLCSQLKADPNTIISLYNVDDPSNKSPILAPVTLKTALLQVYDISAIVRKAQLRVLAQYAKDEEEKAKLLNLSSEDPDKQELYDKFIVEDCRCVSEILKEFKSVEVPLDHFLEVLPKLQPRYYSISSSPSVTPGRVHLTAVLVHYHTKTKREVFGVATNWLANHQADPEKKTFPRIPAFIRKSNFKLPANPKTPVIMVGPGTGLAPFRGFIQERAHQLASKQDVGETILFFGCRHPDIDYIYKEELTAFEKDGVLTQLIVAFSRFQEHKVYVQHKMAVPETGAAIWKLLESGAYFYVCGDARNMARDVSEALLNIVVNFGGKSKEDAQKYIDKLQTDQRYLSDVWS